MIYRITTRGGFWRIRIALDKTTATNHMSYKPLCTGGWFL